MHGVILDANDIASEALAAIDYGAGPSILVFSDDAAQRSRIGAAVNAAGGRVSAALPLDDALERIADHAAPDGVVIDISHDREQLAEAIFDSIEQGARSQRFRGLALITPELIDLAAARAGHDDITLLCGADEIDLAAALGELVARRGLWLNDVTTEAGPVKLRELSEEVGRIARTLAALSNREQHAGRMFQGDSADSDALRAAVDAPAIRAMIRARRLRDAYFGSEVFADAAWDMLLDLMAARLEGQAVAVSSLCIAAAVPSTTALRWIKLMTQNGLFQRVADPHDRRRVFIELSPRAVEAMIEYLTAVRRISASPI